jgi:lysine 2,3-aminomutase
MKLDSLHEEEDSPVPGLVHRYPGRALFLGKYTCIMTWYLRHLFFLATSICPVYCRFCTRSYAVGLDTAIVNKRRQDPQLKRWETIFRYIEDHPDLQDIVVSGGDAYYLKPQELRLIGERQV